MKTQTLLLSAAIMMFLPLVSTGQNDTRRTFVQKQSIEAFSSSKYGVIYSNERNTYNIRGYNASVTYGPVSKVAVNPAGWSYAAICKMRKNDVVAIYSLMKQSDVITKFKSETGVSSVSYAPNSKYLALGLQNRTVGIYDSSNLKEKMFDMTVGFVPESIEISSNNYYMAIVAGKNLEVWNLEDKTLRKAFELDSRINSVKFSEDASLMAVLTDDGNLALYDTRSFAPTQNISSLGIARDCAFHFDGKYIAVITGDTRITIINRLDPSDRRYVDNEDGHLDHIAFQPCYDGTDYVLTSGTSSIYLDKIYDLTPNYTKLLSDELEMKMNAWLKIGENETEADYKLRVNDETRLNQARLFEQEIATKLAGNLLTASTITLGAFNPEISKLTVNFDNMPPVYLDVPEDQVNNFLSTDNLEFRNPKFGLTTNDKFELVYLEVYNKTNNQTYLFDNRERRSLEYLKLDENYVPLEFINLKNDKETKLKETVDEVVNKAMNQNVLSNHTNIGVDSKVVSSNNAKGEKILNYEVNIQYTVEKGFSAQEDFSSGAYITEKSGAASAMVEIIRQSLTGSLSEYVKPGKKIKMIITGMADNLPIRGKIAYDGRYGNYFATPVYGDKLFAITVNPDTGITENNQLAFIRAAGVNKAILDSVPALSEMDVETDYHIYVSSATGGEYRRIKVQFIFVDAF